MHNGTIIETSVKVKSQNGHIYTITRDQNGGKKYMNIHFELSKPGTMILPFLSFFNTQLPNCSQTTLQEEIRLDPITGSSVYFKIHNARKSMTLTGIISN